MIVVSKDGEEVGTIDIEEEEVYTDDDVLDNLAYEILDEGVPITMRPGSVKMEPATDENVRSYLRQQGYDVSAEPKETTDAATKMTKEEVDFEHPAQGEDCCRDCKYFQSPGCSLVQGKITAQDWCEEFHRGTRDAATDPHLIRTEEDVEGHLVFQGLHINVENLRGSTRHGKSFHQRMTAPYGYIRNTEGADGDAVDCFIGPVSDASMVYVVHTKNPKTGLYDEDKCFLGFETAFAAQEAFFENYDDPGDFFESMEKFTIGDFKRKLRSLRGRKITADVASGAA